MAVLCVQQPHQRTQDVFRMGKGPQLTEPEKGKKTIALKDENKTQDYIANAIKHFICAV